MNACRRGRSARRALPALLWLVVLAACGETSDLNASPGPVNVLFVSIDTLRADHLHAYGYPRQTSPHLDRLAREGVLFETAVAETSWTLPAHVTLLTGLPSRVHGVVYDGTRLDEARRTLPQLFRAAGHRTRGFVSGPYLHRIFGFDRGFETYRLLGESVYDEEAFELGDTTRDLDWLDRKLAFDESFHGARSSPDLTKLVEQSLEELKGEPFFLFVHMFDPHADYDPPERYWRAFDPDYAGDLDATRYTSNPRITADMPPRDLEHVIARYDGEILWTDEHVGRMLDALERHGRADRTLVVVTSDHGEEFFEHGRAGHRMSLYDEQLLVPLLMRLPGRIPAGLRYGGQVRATDVAPTILELAGLPPEAQILGRSLVPYLDGRRASEDLPAVSTLVYPQSESMKSLRVPEWKLLEVQSAAHREPARSVYFDLAADPGEQRALSTRGQEHVLRALAQLESQADSWRRGLPGEGDTSITLPPALRDALEALGYGETDAASP